MSEPLFLDKAHKLSFQKIAMPVRLSESPEAWQRDVAGEVYKQLPYLGDYAVNVILDRVDVQRGYGFGSAHVSNRTDAPMQDQAEQPSIRIPIVIRDYVMAPLDIFIDGEGVYPLTESRIRERLFRTDTFELSTRKPSDKGIVDQLYPPFRTNYGLGSVGSDTMGIGKYASKKGGSLIEKIASTIPESEADRFVDYIAGDTALAIAASRNPTFQKLAMTIAMADRKSLQKTASELVDSIRPTVVQLQKKASGEFLVKWANSSAYKPQEDTVDPGTVSGMAGMDLSGMQPGATITLSTEKAKKTSLTEDVYVQVSEYGFYTVQDMESNAQLQGWVLPVVDFDMQPLEMYLFADSEGAWSVQDEIAGRNTHATEDLQSSMLNGDGHQAQGTGVFVSYGDTVRCLLPMTIQNATQGPDGNMAFMGETMFGEPVVLHPTEGLQSVEALEEGEYAIPMDLMWMPLNGEPVFLAKTPEDIDNTQQAQQMPNSIQLGSTGPGEFSMDGAPLAKMAKAEKQFLKTAEAEFLLVAAGVNPFEARAAMQKAEDTRMPVKLAALSITPLAFVHREMQKKAASTLSKIPDLRKDLIKEAATMDDADTADKVLSMNFINPDNLSTFASYLPDLDESAKKLAEMLFAIRMGMSSVDEGAVERSMKGLEDVIEGLKILQQKVSA